MTTQKQMTEKELDQVSGGPLNPDSMMPNRASRHIVHPNYRQSKNGKPSIGYTEVEWT